MKTLRSRLFLTAFLAFLATAGSAFFPFFDNGNDSPPPVSPTWDLIVRPGNEIYPSYVIAAATRVPLASDTATDSAWLSPPASGVTRVGDPESLIGIRLSGISASSSVKVLITSRTIMDESVLEATLASSSQPYLLTPKLLWNYTFLAGVQQIVPVDVSAEFLLNGKSLGKKTKTVKLRPINDCPYSFEDEFGVQNLWWMFAAYVNENHPWVDSVLKEAFQQKLLTQFDDYQAGDPKEVYRQVYAVWHVLHGRGLRYSSIINATTSSETSGSQHVRFLDESMNSSQANCVDGSVLLASILGKIGLDCFLVMTPTHMFIGFYLDADHATMRFLETTQIGLPGDDQAPAEDPELSHFFGDEFAEQASWRNFQEAICQGRTAWAEAHPFIEAGEKDYATIDIEEARSLGIIPIGFTGRKESTGGTK